MLNLGVVVKCVVAGSILVAASCGKPTLDSGLAGQAAENPQLLSQEVDAPAHLTTVEASAACAVSSASEKESASAKGGGAVIKATAKCITLNVENYPTAALLDEIAKQSGVAISLNQPLTDHRTSLQLTDVPLDWGLRRILVQQDVFFSFTPGIEESPAADEGALLLTGVWIFSSGQGSQIIPIPASQLAHSTELSQKLTHADPNVRGNAAELLIARNGANSLEDVRLALNDQDERVRERTLRAALSAGVDLPTLMLETLVQTDSSPSIRSLALSAITSGPAETIAANPNIKIIAQAALNDSSEHVQEQAREVLAQLEQFKQLEATPPHESDQSFPISDAGDDVSELIASDKTPDFGEESP